MDITKYKRFKRLMNKIRVRINIKYGKEVNLDLKDIKKQFPHLAKALIALQKFDTSNIIPIPIPKIYNKDKINAYIVRTSGVTLIKAGGGRLIKKENIVPKA